MSRHYWAIEWRSKNRMDGERRYFFGGGVYSACPGPLLFRTRVEARSFIAKHYGYIAHRPDLRREPHGWRMPQPVKVKVVLQRDTGLPLASSIGAPAEGGVESTVC